MNKNGRWLKTNFIKEHELSAVDLQNLYTSNRNDDPASIRWINSDLIGFTYKMKNITEETDTA